MADLRPKITSLATTNDDAILIVDKVNRRVQKFRQDGTFLCFIGGSHVFQSPFSVAEARNGDIIICESDAHQIKIVEGENGRLKNIVGAKGIGKGKFLYPRGIAVDNESNILVADSGNHQINVISTKDGEEASFGRLGSCPGDFDTPYDVALTNDEKKIVVVDARNHRLQIFTRAIPNNSFQGNLRCTAKEDCSEVGEDVENMPEQRRDEHGIADGIEFDE